jgi:hypothetical protein
MQDSISTEVPKKFPLKDNNSEDRNIIKPKIKKKPPYFLSLTSENYFDESDKRFRKIKDSDINTMAWGIIKLINLTIKEDVDTIFFLDKSGRPAGYLFLKLWHNIFPDYLPPSIKFIEIGRTTKYSFPINKQIRDELTKRYSDLKNQTICVADEYKSSGSTLELASNICSEVFKKAKRFIPVAIFDELPAWYSDTYGLGVEEEGKGSFLVRPLNAKWSIYEENPALKLRRQLSLFALELAKRVTINPKRKF